MCEPPPAGTAAEYSLMATTWERERARGRERKNEREREMERDERRGWNRRKGME